MGRELGGEQIRTYVLLSHSVVHLKISQRCYSVILQYKIKNVKKRNRFTGIKRDVMESLKRPNLQEISTQET